MTKNLNWEISTKNLVTFKRWDGVNDKRFWYYGSSLKSPFLCVCVGGEGVGAWKTTFLGWGRESPKKGGLDSLQI